MSKFKDLTGMTFGKLKVLGFTEVRGNRTYFNCLCECGGEVECASGNLVSGNTKSCGCSSRKVLPLPENLIYDKLVIVSEAPFDERKDFKRREFIFKCSCGNTISKSLKDVKDLRGIKSCGCETSANKSKSLTKHGLSGKRQYRSWQHMKDRCNNPNSEYYNYYGGRGITYDPKWEKFEDFWKDMEEGYSSELELDRIDPNGNYCKENCRWASESEQAYNQRLRVTNTSGKTGVYFIKRSGRWSVEIQGKLVGYFDSYDSAVEKRLELEKEVYGYVKD